MGENSVLNSDCRIDNRGFVMIGNNVSISNEVTILTADHDMDSKEMKGRQRKVIIDDNVWIGTRALIMPGVQLSKGSVVGAGSVVTKIVESHNVVAGIPAKKIKERLVKGEYNYTASYKRLFH